MRPLLALLSAANTQTRSSALQLTHNLCLHGAAAAMLAAGAAAPLTKDMVRAAAVAKGWGGGASSVSDASKDAGLALTALAALGEEATGKEAVRHAVRQHSALPSLVAMLGDRDEAVNAAAATILALIDPSDNAALAELQNTGGIALLCETLVSASATETSHLQAMQTLATLSASPTPAVAIAEYPGAISAYVNLVCAPRSPEARAAALTTLAHLSTLGALGLEVLRSQPLLIALADAASAKPADMPAAEQPADDAQRAAALALLAQAAQDGACRLELAQLNTPPVFAAAIADGGETAKAATHALAHFAADETFRLQLASWGAPQPLASQLSPNTQPDARTRAMALSALANYSYVDAAALAEAGVTPTLGQLLFEGDAAILGMALTALTNLIGASDAVAPALLQAGTPLAVHSLLSHSDHTVVDQAVGALIKMCAEPLLAAALADVPGAVGALVGLIVSSDESAAVPLATALGQILAAKPDARGAAMGAGGAAALGTALLGCPEAEGRLVLATTLATVVQSEWGVAYEACGWPALLAVLNLHVAATAAGTAKPEGEAQHIEAARGTAALLTSSAAAREALAADPNALRFVAHTLGACVSTPELSADPSFALGTAHAVVLLLCASAAELVAEGMTAVLQLAAAPRLAAALASAGAAPHLVRAIAAAAPPDAAVPLAKALGAMLEEEPGARGAALEAGGATALGTALLACSSADDRLVLSLTLAALVRGDLGALQSACGWPAVVAVLTATAATASGPMAEFADSAAASLASALPTGATPAATSAATPAEPAAESAAAQSPVASHRPNAPTANYAWNDEDSLKPTTAPVKTAPVKTTLRGKPNATTADLD